MHHAPSVPYPVGRSRFLHATVFVLWLAGVAAAAAQAWHVGGWTPPVLATLGSCLLAGALAARWLRQRPQGVLRWDGEAWFWTPQPPAATAADGPLASPPCVHLDGQQRMLVSLAPAGGATVWLWLESAHSPQRWDDLRRALFDARPGAPDADAPDWRGKGLV